MVVCGCVIKLLVKVMDRVIQQEIVVYRIVLKQHMEALVIGSIAIAQLLPPTPAPLPPTPAAPVSAAPAPVAVTVTPTVSVVWTLMVNVVQLVAPPTKETAQVVAEAVVLQTNVWVSPVAQLESTVVTFNVAAQ